MRARLRPAMTADELARVYATPHDHSQWEDHIVRVGSTIAVGRALLGDGVHSGADLSAGSRAILAALPVEDRIYGDLAPGLQFTGPIEETLEQIPDVDVLVCCETLEHLDDPDAVLRKIRTKSRALLLSTPVDAWDDTNPEHYWAWSRADVEEMLAAAGFELVHYVDLDMRAAGPGYYCFGIWGCR